MEYMWNFASYADDMSSTEDSLEFDDHMEKKKDEVKIKIKRTSNRDFKSEDRDIQVDV